EEPACGHGVLRGADVVRRRLGVAGRVVVAEDDPRRVAPQGFGEELADAHRGAGHMTGVDRADRDEPLFAGEERDDEGLAVAVREVRREYPGRGGWRVEDVALALRREGPPAELERRDDAGGRRRT